MSWWGAQFRQTDQFSTDGRRLSFHDGGFRGIMTPARANSFAWPGRNGYYINQPQDAGASSSVTLMRNVGLPVDPDTYQQTPGFGQTWTAPAAHKYGHYFAKFNRANAVPVRGDAQGYGSYIVLREGVNGYPAFPEPTHGVGFASGGVVPVFVDDDPYLVMYAGQGLSRMAWKFSEGPSVLEGKIGGWYGGHRVAWETWKDMDPARPMRASVLTQADGRLGYMEDPQTQDFYLSAINDPRMSWVRYLNPGNELNNNGINEGGNLGPDLAGYVAAFADLMEAHGHGDKWASPSNTSIHPGALADMRAFFIALKATGRKPNARMLHAYNGVLGDVQRARLTLGPLAADHMDPALGLGADVPIVHEEAGTFFAEEYGQFDPLRQAQQVALETQAMDAYLGVHGIWAKEMRIEFHPAGGFGDFPSAWESINGPYPTVCWTLVDSQEKFGCSQKVEQEMPTDDPQGIIANVHRRANSTGMVAIYSAGREDEILLRVPQAAGQTRFVRNSWGDEGVVQFDGQGVAHIVAGGRVDSEEETWGRPMTYLRLAADDEPEFVSDTRYGTRTAYAGVSLRPDNFATQAPRLIGPVRNRDDVRDSLALLNAPNREARPQAVWRGDKSVDQAGGELRMLADIPMQRLQMVKFNGPAPWHHMGAIRRLFVEAWNGGEWVPFGEINETGRATALPWRGISSCHFMSLWDDTNAFKVKKEAGVVTNLVRFRLTDASVGSAATAATMLALGSREPVLDEDGKIAVDADFQAIGMTDDEQPTGLATADGVTSERWWWEHQIEFFGTSAEGTGPGSPGPFTPPPGLERPPAGLYLSAHASPPNAP